MYHIICINSRVKGHLGCFQLLAIIKKSPLNILEHAYLSFVGSSFGYMLMNGIAGSSSRLFPVFWGTTRLFSRVAIPACNQSHQQWVIFPFLHILSSICCYLSFWSICISLMTKNVISLGASQPFKIPQLRILYLCILFFCCWFLFFFFFCFCFCFF